MNARATRPRSRVNPAQEWRPELSRIHPASYLGRPGIHARAGPGAPCRLSFGPRVAWAWRNPAIGVRRVTILEITLTRSPRMSIQMQLWSIESDRPVRLRSAKLDLEARLEQWICQDLSL